LLVKCLSSENLAWLARGHALVGDHVPTLKGYLNLVLEALRVGGDGVAVELVRVLEERGRGDLAVVVRSLFPTAVGSGGGGE